MKIQTVCQYLSSVAPLSLAESWDNVGLLLGDPDLPARRLMTCLTITPEVVDEAIEQRADLIVTHHPLPFKAPLKITTVRYDTSMIWRLSRAGICVYSAHTAFDSAEKGINAQWADLLGLNDVFPLIPAEDGTGLGSGRYGSLTEVSLTDLAQKTAAVCGATDLRLVGSDHQRVSRLAIACGSGGSFLASARRKGCDAMLTGEATFHACLEARAAGIGLILVGHFYSERFAMERLAEMLQLEFTELAVWASQGEIDPLHVSGPA